uniref:protein-L-isoaspartate(D-aspartate) O-methyltransferase n=2 Tax=Cacopsylla melanoneura TaxID=428564 RepID=A0A8D9EF43_9HEMI
MLRLSLCFGIALCLFAYVATMWTGRHKSHESLLGSLFALGLIKREATIELMKKFDRYDFLPHAPEESWMNIPVCINYSATMPEGSHHGQTLDALYKWLKPGAKCLDIGSGTGYISACMAEMAGPTGKVYGVEHIPFIMEKSIEAIRINHPDLLDDGILEFLCQDGRRGLHEKGPFDIIHMGGSVVNNPYHLMSQLKPNGCLIAPVGLNYETQSLKRFIKYNETSFKVDDITQTIQEPLIPRYEQEKQWLESCAEFNRSFDKLCDTLKVKEIKAEKERKKAEEKLREKMATRSILDVPIDNPERFTHIVNDLSAIFAEHENDTDPFERFERKTKQMWDSKNYG